jgi:thiol-disulfide isomerase/thioredoxin|tara:strand:+ start:52 stop:435 length:384 start_codon:yes stop_codon:yes gene_type:complete
MFKKLLILGLMVTSLFGEVKELTDENFEKATRRGLVAVEFWATWNETNKVEILYKWSEDTFDAKVYRVNIDLYPSIQSDNDVVILPTIIFYDGGEEVERLQGDMSFTLKVTADELDEIVEEILSDKF